MSRRLPAIVVALVLLAGGCGESPSERFPPTAQVQSLRLPFDAYTPSTAELYLSSNARDWLTLDCMTARRYDWKVIRRPTDLKDLRNRRRYGVIENSIAQRYGYHVPEGLLTPLEVDRTEDARENSLGTEQRTAAYGVGGCAREAAARLRPDRKPDLALLGRLDNGSLTGSLHGPAVAPALREWRDCVGRAGFDYTDPFAAMADPGWWVQDRASDREIAVAVADVGCKERTGLVSTWHAAEVRMQDEQIRKHPGEFREIRAAVEEENAAAWTVMAGRR